MNFDQVTAGGPLLLAVAVSVLAGIVSIGDVVKLRLTELESENQSLIGYLSNTP